MAYIKPMHNLKMRLAVGSIFACIVAAALAFSLSFPSTPTASADSTSAPLSGWAWSSTIGWINLSGVFADISTGNLSGYAWSSNIGWVSFNSSEVSGCPAGPCAPKIDLIGAAAGKKISGFIRACAGSAPGDCSSSASRTDGWDGWIELSGTNHAAPDTSGTGGVTYDSANHKIVGYAWGSDVVGWVNFSDVLLNMEGVCPGGEVDYPTCTTPPPTPCTGPDGVTSIAVGSVRTFYDNTACLNQDFMCTSSGLSPDPSSYSSYTSTSAGPSCGVAVLPTVSFRMSPDTVSSGGSCTMIWGATGADSCVVTGQGEPAGGAVVNKTGGTALTPPITVTTGTSQYTLTCTSDAGSVSKNAVCYLNPTIHEN